MMKINFFKMSVLFPSICLFYLFNCNLFAQTGLNEKSASFNAGRIWKKDGNKIEFSSIKIGERSVTYKMGKSENETTIDMDQIVTIQIEKKRGDALEMGIKGSLYGLGVGLGSSLASGLDGDKTAFLTLGTTIVSGLAFFVLGSTAKLYETVYSNPKYINQLNVKAFWGLVSKSNVTFCISLTF